jgi:hypothetical protein
MITRGDVDDHFKPVHCRKASKPATRAKMQYCILWMRQVRFLLVRIFVQAFPFPETPVRAETLVCCDRLFQTLVPP